MRGGGLKCVQILDQNGGENYEGLNTSIESYDWIKTSKVKQKYKKGAWEWLYKRFETCKKNNGKNFDPSDAGMVIFLLTGIEKTNPGIARKIMENTQNQSTKIY